MRLTLRTLLAYLDDILEPADREDLQKQIDVSDYARDLVHRTREVSRRLRLGTPEVLGSGSIDDPNTVAEYLDNTLPMEKVPEFERVCLESDVMLAEAAASHHVLAMVLGKSADVDPDTRNRMHDLPNRLAEAQRDAQKLRIEPGHEPYALATETPEVVVAEPEPVMGPSVEPNAELSAESLAQAVPDYLRQDQSALLRWAPALAALVLLGITGFMMFGSSVSTDVASTEVTSTDGASTGVTSDGVSADGASNVQEPVIDASTIPAIVINTEEDPKLTEETSLSVGGNDLDTDLGADLGNGPVDPIEVAPTEEPVDTPVEENLAEEADPGLAEEGTSPLVAVDPASATPEESSEPEPPVVEPPTHAGRFAGPDNCLLVAESDSGVWQRIESGEQLELGGRLISLPTYRASIELGNGVLLELVGLTQADLSSTEESPYYPRVDVGYGRVLLSNPGEETQKIELVAGGARSVVELDSGATLAIETDRPYKRGTDILNVSPESVTIVYAPMGGITWATDEMQMRFASSKQWELSAEGDPTGFADFGDPGWIASYQLSPWDEQASPLLSRSVFEGQEVWPQLREVIESEAFKEVRALAARCSAVVSHPDPLVASFSDKDQRPVWANNLAELRSLVSRSTIEAERVRRALIDQHGEIQADSLFRMIRGFNEEQIGSTEKERERGALPQIIGWLESEALASRVLANLNLEEVTGRQAVFSPTDTPTKRRQKIRRLRKLLNSNELRVPG